MSVIAGLVHAGSVTLMADSAASVDPCLVMEERHAKIIRLGNTLVGVTGAIRLRQVLLTYATAPRDDVNTLESLIRWIDHLRELARQHGILRVKEGVEELSDNRLLVAMSGRLFEIDSALQVVEPAVPYWSIGCGQAEARAALHALVAAHPGWEHPESLLRSALEAVAAFNAHVRPPFVSMMIA